MRPTLYPLTALRFFAAVAVVMCHRVRTGPDDWLPYERHGAAGVTFFFLLSGFILAYTYHDRLLGRRPGAVRDFYVARAARILPAYLLAFALAVWTCAEGRALLSGRFGAALWPAVTHLTLTQAFVPKMSHYFGFNAPAWSLSCECFFYLTFPLLLLGLATGPRWRRAAVFALASAACAAVLGAYLWGPYPPAAAPETWLWLVYVCPLTRLFDFACGVGLGVLFVRVSPAVGPAGGRAFWLWGVAEAGAVGLLWASLHFCPLSPGAGGAPPATLPLLTGQGYYVPAFAALVWVGAVGRGPLSRLLTWSPLVYLGELSYGVYICHVPVIRLVALQLTAPAAISAVAGAAALGVAALSFHFWETPVRRWVRGRPTPAAPVVPPLRRAA
jgi:peptidoglycan/LPS O-acetylase OafA/YrhL